MNRTILLALLLAMPLAFADVGPGPAEPSIEILFERNSTPYTDPLTVVYVCNEPLADPTDSGPMGQREVALACQMGSCTNENWFYKLSPCFEADDGYIKFKMANDTDYTMTKNVSFGEEGGTLRVDIDTGNTSTVLPSGTGCAPAALLLSLLGFLLIEWE